MLDTVPTTLKLHFNPCICSERHLSGKTRYSIIIIIIIIIITILIMIMIILID